MVGRVIFNRGTFAVMRAVRGNQLSTAITAGAATLIAAALAVVLFLAPVFAGETNFPGHQHPPGTPDHIHTLEQAAVALGVFEAFVVFIVVVFVAELRLPMRYENPANEVRYGVPMARAPPTIW